MNVDRSNVNSSTNGSKYFGFGSQILSAAKDVEPMLLSLYLFGGITIILTILAGLLFFIREYAYNFKSRKSRQSVIENNLDYHWNRTANNREVLTSQKSDIWKELDHHGSYWSSKIVSSAPMVSDGTFSQSPSLKSPSGRICEKSDSSFEEHLFLSAMPEQKNYTQIPIQREISMRHQLLPPPAPLDVVSAREAFSVGNRFFFYTGVHGDFNSSGKIVYGTDDLMKLCPKNVEFPVTPRLEVDDFAFNRKNHFDIEKWVANPLFSVNMERYNSVWKVDRAIRELSLFLTNNKTSPIVSGDSVTKKILIVKLLVFGANDKNFSNPNIYLAEFNNLMERIISTGTIFNLLQDANDMICGALVDFVLRYIWCHLRYMSRDHKAIDRQFETWKLGSPYIQRHHVLFRYLCATQLGIYTVGNLNLQRLKDTENKLSTMMNFMAVDSSCNDYLGFIPVISQAVEFVDRVASQRMFYDLILVIIEKHKDCCMNDYLIEDEDNLKPLIQHGFWVKNDAQVREIAQEIHLMVVEKYPQTMSWWKDIEGGRRYIGPLSFRFKENMNDVLKGKSKKSQARMEINNNNSDSKNVINPSDNSSSNNIDNGDRCNNSASNMSFPGSFNF
ncbi:hypothetical protein DASC09_050480 [Saccharomycopsis crataegensis]|uniref:Uncharacterized protein n=1 Tax=Saccharomycopsis crataegensis TaxID=43959 RepID=A0AAV5QUB0_9ASCO|nr:hypothetical protein DASC09_050480 [Saccharomycopsis crataegensis]